MLNTLEEYMYLIVTNSTCVHYETSRNENVKGLKIKNSCSAKEIRLKFNIVFDKYSISRFEQNNKIIK